MGFKLYDVGLDELRDVTERDINRWKDLEAAQGVFIPMQRAMIVATRKLWNGEITLEELWALRNPWIERLGLDSSGNEKK